MQFPFAVISLVLVNGKNVGDGKIHPPSPHLDSFKFSREAPLSQLNEVSKVEKLVISYYVLKIKKSKNMFFG